MLDTQGRVSHLNLATTNGHLLRSMSGEADLLQVLREITQNALESGAKNISFHPCFVHARLTATKGKRVDKLAVEDDGEGMTAKMLEAYMMTIGKSSKTLGVDANHGIGLRMMGMRRNHAGMDVISYRDGTGHMVRLIADKNGDYGLFSFETYPDYFETCITVPKPLDDEYHREHGTIVVLHGMDESEHTYPLPGYTAMNMVQFLNRRYFDVPADVHIEVFHGPSTANHDKWPSNAKDARDLDGFGSQMRKVKGAKFYLNKYAMESGEIVLSDGKMMWWAFGDHDAVTMVPKTSKSKKKNDDEEVDDPTVPRTLQEPSGKPEDIKAHSSIKTGSSNGPGHGFTGVLFQNEVYEFSKEHHRFVQAGIFSTKARKRVTLLFAPKPGLVQPNPARSRVVLQTPGSEDRTPWSQWGAEFNRNMPKTIRDIVNENTISLTGDLQSKVYEKLEELKKYLDLRRLDKGSPSDVPSSEGGSGSHKDPKNPKDPKDPKNPKANAPRKLWPTMIVEDHQPEPGQSFRPAEYNDDMNVLTVYKNHHRYTDAVQRFQVEFGGALNGNSAWVDDVICNAVLRVYFEELAQRVVFARQLHSTAEYRNRTEFLRLISPETLDAVLLAPLSLEPRARTIITGTLQQGPKN